MLQMQSDSNICVVFHIHICHGQNCDSEHAWLTLIYEKLSMNLWDKCILLTRYAAINV